MLVAAVITISGSSTPDGVKSVVQLGFYLSISGSSQFRPGPFVPVTGTVSANGTVGRPSDSEKGAGSLERTRVNGTRRIFGRNDNHLRRVDGSAVLTGVPTQQRGKSKRPMITPGRRPDMQTSFGNVPVPDFR
jgi:hypothetical protein